MLTLLNIMLMHYALLKVLFVAKMLLMFKMRN